MIFLCAPHAGMNFCEKALANITEKLGFAGIFCTSSMLIRRQKSSHQSSLLKEQ
jgi:hypothetical protein